MAEKEGSRVKDEIDLFDFLQIIGKRKYLVISVCITSVLVASLYSYVLIPIIPTTRPRSSIYVLVRVLESGLAVEDVEEWFESGAYKGCLQAHYNQSSVPEIAAKQQGETLLELSMIHREVEEGKLMLAEAVRCLEMSEFSIRRKEEARELAEKEIEKKRMELKMLNESISERKKRIVYEQEWRSVITKRIANVRGQLRELVAMKSDVMERQDKNGDSMWGYYNCLNGVYRLLWDLEERVEQLARNVLNNNGALIELNSKVGGKQIEIDGLEKNMNELKAFESEGPPYVLTKKVRKAKIVGIAGIAGIFIGGFVAFFSEVKRRRNANTAVR